MPDEVNKALLARELNVTDSEAERLRRKYVRDKLDETGNNRDRNLPADPKVVDRLVKARKEGVVWASPELPEPEKHMREINEDELRYQRERASGEINKQKRRGWR